MTDPRTDSPRTAALAGPDPAPSSQAPARRAPAAKNTTARASGPTTEEVDAVMWIGQRMVAIGARSLAAIEAEVSLPQLRVLVILASQGPCSLNAVAYALGIHPSNVTRACDRLVAAGLVRRGEDPTDRRLLALRLTAVGAALIEKVMRHRRAQVEQLLTALPAPQRRSLARILSALATSTGDTDQAAWQAGWASPPRGVATP